MTSGWHGTNFGMLSDGAIADARGSADGSWLEGRTAIVTSGGLRGPHGGAGYAISQLFARHGARVAVVDRDAAAAEVTVSLIRTNGGEAFACRADVSRADDCERAVAEAMSRFGRVDTLATSAAPGDRARLFDVTPERWNEVIAHSLTSAWLMTREAAGAMVAGGSIVNVAPVADRPGTVHGMAQAGLENLTRGAASLLGPQGIRVNCIQLGDLWDAAYAALFLASDRARWVSGHILTVDGGGPHRGGLESRPAAVIGL